MQKGGMLMTIRKFGLLQGVNSVFIKILIACVRLFTIGVICRASSPELFRQQMLYLGFLSMVPFLDLGIGGGKFRLDMLGITSLDTDGHRKIFEMAFNKLCFIYLAYSLLTFLFFSFFKMPFSGWPIIFLFLRAPFNLFYEVLFSENRAEKAYFIEIVEQLLLASVTFISVTKFGIESFQSVYSSTYLFLAILWFSIFLKFKKWNLKIKISNFNIESEEIYFFFHSILSNGFLIFVLFVANYNTSGLDSYEFNVGFRIVSLIYGATLVVLNPIWNRIVKLGVTHSTLEIKNYIVMVMGCAIVGICAFFICYQRLFCFIAGFQPQEVILRNYFAIWIFLIFIFLALDLIIKTVSVRRSIFLWILLYVGGLAFL